MVVRNETHVGPKDIHSSSLGLMKGGEERVNIYIKYCAFPGSTKPCQGAPGLGAIEALAQAPGSRLMALTAQHPRPLFLLCVLTAVSQASNRADAVRVIRHTQSKAPKREHVRQREITV